MPYQLAFAMNMMKDLNMTGKLINELRSNTTTSVPSSKAKAPSKTNDSKDDEETKEEEKE